jgi:lantibiotic biosynthesis protein
MEVNINHILENIAEKIYTKAKSQMPALMNGLGGQILYFAYLHKVTNDKKYFQLLNELVDILLEKSDTFTDYSLATGYSGLGWLLGHLCNLGTIDIDLQDFMGEADENIKQVSLKFMQEGNYDLMFGGLGMALYELEKPEKDIVYLKTCIDLLQKSSQKMDIGISWFQSPIMNQSDDKKKIYNLGLAHGLPSIIVFLSKCYILNIEQEKTYNLIENSINWLLSCKVSDNEISLFPYSIKDNEKGVFSGLRWCYGDFGVSLALLFASKATGNLFWQEEAIEIAEKVALRTNQNDTIIDAHLCHGTSGIAVMFDILFSQTQNIIFKNATDFWLEETIKKYRPSESQVLFNSYKGTDFGWIETNGFLEGNAGIGLALLGLTNKNSYSWSTLLLLS